MTMMMMMMMMMIWCCEVWQSLAEQQQNSR